MHQRSHDAVFAYRTRHLLFLRLRREVLWGRPNSVEKHPHALQPQVTPEIAVALFRIAHWTNKWRVELFGLRDHFHCQSLRRAEREVKMRSSALSSRRKHFHHARETSDLRDASTSGQHSNGSEVIVGKEP